MTASKIFLYFCLSFVGGIFLGSIIKIPQLLMLGVSVLGMIIISVFFKYKKLAVMGFCLIFLLLGVWRYQTAESKITDCKLQDYNDKDENITLVGIVFDEPEIGEKVIQLTVNAEQLAVSNKQLGISGKILVTTKKYPEYKYGDKLKITGKLETPAEDINGFNYKDYLKKDGIFSVMSFPKTELLGSGFGNPIMSSLFSFKNKFKETARKFISPPQEGFLEALIFGDEQNLSKEWKDRLNLTGTRHIAAVSGMNITIIASLLLSFCLALGLWRQQSFYLTIILLIFYILMIGAPASAVRAGIMGGFLLLGQNFGRMSSASRAVFFAATLMLFQNPLLLRLDIGFQLSFLAIMGIIYLQPSLNSLFKKIPNPKLFPLRTALATTISAQIFVLPILIYNFGYFSLLSPITNILIVPFLAPITILIFIFVLSGTIFHPLGFVLSMPVWISLTYIAKIIEFFSRIPFASLKIENIPWSVLVIFYLVLGIIVWRLKKKEKLGFLKY